MADFNEIKSILRGTFDTVADKTRDIAEKTSDKAKGFARIAKLSMEINGERDAIKKAYIEIGKLYYDTHKDDPDGFFSQLCEEVNVAMTSIEEKEAEIASIKKEYDAEEDFEVEFEEVIMDDEEEAPAAEETPEE